MKEPHKKNHWAAWTPAAIGAGLLIATPAWAEAPLPVRTPSESFVSPVLGAPASASNAEISRSSTFPANYSSTEFRVVLRLEERRVYLYSGEMLVSSYPVAVGTAETPTPQGEFAVGTMIVNPVWQSPWTNEVHEPGPDSALGVRWIGFADSEAGSFGFHGTPTIESIGTAASNGCVRMRNEDITALYAAVSIGTPVTVEP